MFHLRLKTYGFAKEEFCRERFPWSFIGIRSFWIKLDHETTGLTENITISKIKKSFGVSDVSDKTNKNFFPANSFQNLTLYKSEVFH